MADMIEHSNFVSMHHMKQEWEDEMVKEDDEKIKAGLTKKCMSCHKGKGDCKCGHCGKSYTDVTTYWGY